MDMVGDHYVHREPENLRNGVLWRERLIYTSLKKGILLLKKMVIHSGGALRH